MDPLVSQTSTKVPTLKILFFILDITFILFTITQFTLTGFVLRAILLYIDGIEIIVSS